MFSPPPLFAAECSSISNETLAPLLSPNKKPKRPSKQLEVTVCKIACKNGKITFAIFPITKSEIRNFYISTPEAKKEGTKKLFPCC